MRSTTMQGSARSPSRTVALLFVLLLSAALALGTTAVFAFASDSYRAVGEEYHEEGFGLLAGSSLPFTEYRAPLERYHEEGFGEIAEFLPFTEYRALTGGYGEEGFGLVR